MPLDRLSFLFEELHDLSAASVLGGGAMNLKGLCEKRPLFCVEAFRSRWFDPAPHDLGDEINKLPSGT